MDKEDKKGNENKKEGEEMAVLEKEMTTFADFVRKNRKKIWENAESNTIRNNDGDVVISKDDPSRNEHKWTEIYKELEKE